MTRRRQTVHERRMRDSELRRSAAQRQLGKELAWAYFFRDDILPALVRLAVVAAVAGGAAWVWFNIEHRTIAVVLVLLGILLCVGYGWWQAITGGMHARMMASAVGRRRSPRWHFVGVAGACLLVAGILLARASA